jgi:hypothetical protein
MPSSQVRRSLLCESYSCRLILCIRSLLSTLATSSWMDLLLAHSLPKTRTNFSHFYSRHQTSCDTIAYYTRRGCGTPCEMRPMYSHHRQRFRPRILPCRWTIVSGQLEAPSYPSAAGSRLMKSTFTVTSSAVHFSHPYSLLIIMEGSVSGYQTSSRVAIKIFTTGIEKRDLGERRQHIYVST